jgi:uncharacterized alkaline shock family protein YloU
MEPAKNNVPRPSPAEPPRSQPVPASRSEYPPPPLRSRSHPAPSPRPELPPPAERGETHIEDEVVSIIARIAAEQVPGIHRLGESSFRSVLSRLGRSHGVDAEVGMKEAAVDVEVVIEFGFPIREIAAEIRERVISTVETMTGRQVVEVNVFVIDVFIPKTDRRHRRSLE